MPWRVGRSHISPPYCVHHEHLVMTDQVRMVMILACYPAHGRELVNVDKDETIE